MKARKLGWSIAAGCLVASTAVSAATVQQNFTVNLKITPECVIEKGTDITFAATGYLDTDVDANGSIKVGCTKGTVPKISLNGGDGAACSSGASRCMESAGGEQIDYVLYHDSVGGTVWTPGLQVNGPAGDGAVASNKGVANKTVTIYGRVPPQNTPTPGDYADTVTATVEF